MIRKLIKAIFIFSSIAFLIAGIAGAVVGSYYYIRLTRDLPKIQRISDYKPKAVTKVLADDGTLMAELSEERRYLVKLDQIPLRVRQAFLAAEDANFYEHPGIDFISIARALYKNFQHKGTKQGASTITQQIVKSLLLSREKTYKRKIREAILAYRLEKALTKDEILEMYLNEIFLGQTAYGVAAAAKVHFRKELDELTVAEAAYLAGLPQRPSYYTRPKNRPIAEKRKRYVLQQMLRNNFISEAQHAAALKEELTIYLPERKAFYQAPYFASHVVKVLDERLKGINSYLTATNPGGFIVETTASPQASVLAEKAVQRGLREVDKRRGWRGPIEKLPKDTWESFLEKQSLEEPLELGRVYKAVVTARSRKGKRLTVRLGDYEGGLSLAKVNWAKRFLTEDGKAYAGDPFGKTKVGSVIEVSLDPTVYAEAGDVAPQSPLVLQLDQTPEVQAAFAVQNALTGEVKALVGGYDYQQSVFNRATQGLLQPGSAFKPFIYLAAINELGYTPSTIVPDSPVEMNDGTGKIWAPQNYDHKFLGPMTLRNALQQSRNVVSVHLLERVGIDTGIAYAKKLGISTPISRNMSIALGTAEVHLIELVRAYSAFASGGLLPETRFIKRILDRDGNVLYEEFPRAEPVLDEEEAFIMANMMKGVVERGTAQRVKKLERPVAGKTGTTNDQMDAWFVGYTPEWVAGAWVGFDVKKTIGRYETGGKAAAPIFIYFMEEFLKDEPVLDFEIPDGVIPVRINPKTGALLPADADGGFIEYYISGTEPTQVQRPIDVRRDYLSNPDF